MQRTVGVHQIISRTKDHHELEMRVGPVVQMREREQFSQSPNTLSSQRRFLRRRGSLGVPVHGVAESMTWIEWQVDSVSKQSINITGIDPGKEVCQRRQLSQKLNDSGVRKVIGGEWDKDDRRRKPRQMRGGEGDGLRVGPTRQVCCALYVEGDLEKSCRDEGMETLVEEGERVEKETSSAAKLMMGVCRSWLRMQQMLRRASLRGSTYRAFSIRPLS